MKQFPLVLGSVTGLAAANGTPSAATAGFATAGSRFINLWYNMSGGTSVTTRVWLYRELVGWILYTDIPTTTLLTANGGGIIQVETRGAQRIYAEVITFVGPPTVGIYFDGVTY